MMSLAYNMLITGIICYWAYFKVVEMLPVVASTVGTLMVPVIGVFSNELVFGVTPHLVDYTALTCVAAAALLVVMRRRSPSADDDRERESGVEGKVESVRVEMGVW